MGCYFFFKVESVELALNILDGYDFRGHKIKVQRAKFEMRGEYNPALKPKKKKGDKEKLQKIKEKLFDWRPEKMRGERGKHERTVIIKNLFTPELFDKEVHLIIDYQNDLREECSKCGTVRKVIVYDRHQDGVAQNTDGQIT
uniref:RRM domain-containing protein n=1 Tax=Megaselia scalaris TaxID=36166 RepID=T1GHU8_MEGSC